MPTVADYIEKHQQEIVDEFVSQARELESARGLSDEEVRDFLPYYLEFLAKLSRDTLGDEAELHRTEFFTRHLDQRVQLGYHQGDATTELQIFARILFSLWGSRPPMEQPPPEDIERLSAELESVVDQVPAVFSGYTAEDRQAEKRHLRRLEQLSREHMRYSSDLLASDRVSPYLAVLQEALDADGAALLVLNAAGDSLLPAAAHGACDMSIKPVSLARPGYFVEIMAAEEPVQLTAAADSAAPVDSPFKDWPLQSLFGVRLYPYGQLVGVLLVGRHQYVPLSPRGKRFLAALADHLAAIIDRLRLIEQIRESKALVEQVVEQVGEGIIVCDAAGRISLFNPAAVQQHGTRAVGVKPPSWPSTYGMLTTANEPLPLEEAPLYRALQGEEVRDARFNVRRSDDEIRMMLGTATPIRRPDGGIAGAVVVTRDKTEQLAQAEERERLLERAQRAVQSRDELLAVIAHDLRNPAGVVKLTAQIIRRLFSGETIWPKLEPHVESIQQLATYMARLINDLVDVASLERGQLAANLQTEDPWAIIEDVLERYRALAQERGLRLESLHPEVLPLVMADRDRILQVLGNLLSNAISVTAAGGRISVGAQTGKHEVTFYVSDTGPGIPPEDHGRLFERYRRGKAVDYRGTGLGLYIASAIIKAHNGRIWVESELGQGSTFYFTIPRAPH